MKSGKCFNSLRDHFVKNWTFGNNCRRCGNACDKKHFFLQQDYFVDIAHRPPKTSAEPAVTMRSVKIGSVKAAYNRLTVDRVMNHATGHSKLVYCQHDPGSQLTVIASSLVEDLRLEPFKLDTLVGDKNTSTNLVKLIVQSVKTKELFCDVTAAVISPWVDDAETLPHKQDLSNSQHFEGVKLFTLDNGNTADIIIGNDNAFSMNAMEELLGEVEMSLMLYSLSWEEWPLEEDRSYMQRLLRFLECKLVWPTTICRRISLT